MCLVSALRAYFPPSLDPLPGLLLMRVFRVLIQNLNLPTQKRTSTTHQNLLIEFRLIHRERNIFWKGHCMLHRLRPSAILADKRYRRCEYTFASLSCLHCARSETLPLSHMFHVVHDRNLRVSSQHEIAVHAVNSEVMWNRPLRRGETL